MVPKTTEFSAGTYKAAEAIARREMKMMPADEISGKDCYLLQIVQRPELAKAS
jgi:hypothetical protein